MGTFNSATICVLGTVLRFYVFVHACGAIQVVKTKTDNCKVKDSEMEDGKNEQTNGRGEINIDEKNAT